MLGIEQYIKTLVMSYNCVIIPELGGFVTQTVPAVWDELTNTFRPPLRIVGFNSALTHNDGLLIQYISATYHCDINKASHIVQQDVAYIKDCLNRNGAVEFSYLGTLSQKADGTLTFKPINNGFSCPSLYGLYPYAFHHQDRALRLGAKSSSIYSFSNKSNPKFSRHYKELVNYIAAAIVTLIFYFAWAIPSKHFSNNYFADISIAPTLNNTDEITLDTDKLLLKKSILLK